ncbi:uncharacterized protein N7484_007241 [Penicillium longicatenatum]|uniref:uncharacterized protein n=1 Tax=Penicillium longicatenatum TaxID=1561947 RepID=UPI002548B170|nr:uncharacterized protein N7484_007241 [Penicillium longicatenatum]KAJ5639379.1 hypothetical protein N7484_007241 [Penicillium longicatenatum]
MLQLRIVPCLLALLSLRLAAALTVPQEVLHEQNDIYELDDDDLSVNTTDISAYDVSTLDFRSCETWDVDQWDYDVAIVGGGPAGLAASMSLGRVARTSLMYDSGQYRNARTRYMHDVLGQDGQVPKNFRIAVRGQIDQYYSDYSFRATQGTRVTAIQPLSKGFRVYDDKGGKTLVRKVILATGITDVLPNKTGFAAAFGRGLFWCPWCDGYDYKGRTVVVIGTPGKFGSAIGNALNMRKLTTNIQIVAGGVLSAADKAAAEERWPGWENILKTKYNIPVHQVDVKTIERTAKGSEPGDDEYKLTLSGQPLTITTHGILISAPTKQTSELHKQLHLQMDGSSIKVEKNMETSVGGIYAVGDANNDGSTNAYHAMWSAKRAVVNAHVAISKEEYLESVPAAMVAAHGGDEEFYQRQIEELQWMMGNDVEELYKALGG